MPVFFEALKKEGYAVVAAYNPDRSMLHPMPHDSLQAIGDAYDQARCAHGFYETWMAVYNECVRQGQNPSNAKTDAARAEAIRIANITTPDAGTGEKG